MNINCVTIRNVNLFFRINAFVEKFADMQIIFLLDFFSKYDQFFFDKGNRNFITFMISFELLCMTTFFQKIINFVEQFVRIASHISNVHILKKCQTFVNDITIKNDRNNHDNKQTVFENRIFVFRYIQNLNKMLIDIKRSRIIIFDEKFQFCMFDIKIVDFVCDEINRHFDTIKIIEIIKRKNCRNVTIVKAIMKI